MLRAALTALALAVGLVAATPVALADRAEVERRLIVAEDAFLDVEYEAALEALEDAEAATGTTDEQLERILALRGTIQLLLGHAERARANYARLLVLSPGYRLPSTHPPRAAQFLDQVRAEAPSPPEIDHTPPGRFRAAEPMELLATVRNASTAHTVRLFYRRAGDRSYASTEMLRDEADLFSASIPAFGAFGASEADSVEYFIVVTLGEQRLANAGTPRRPLTFSIERGPGSPRGAGRSSGGLATHWWFWAAIGGAVAVAAGVGLGLGLGLTQGPETGAVRVELDF